MTSNHGHRLTKREIDRMRSMKEEGLGLKPIAKVLGCSPSTVSLYTRDLFTNSQRQYGTESEARAAITEATRVERIVNGRSYDNDVRSRWLPGKCVGCQKAIRTATERCMACHRGYLMQKAFSRPDIERIRKEKAMARLEESMPKQKHNPCAESTTDTHYWILDSHNQGVCKYCGLAREFASTDYRSVAGMK